MLEKLIRCTRCNRIIPQYALFGDFGESSTLPGVEWASDDLDEQREFTKAHEGHPLEELTIDRQTLVSDRPAFEPCRVSYAEATNGKERFLIKRNKPGFDRPASYELIPGKIRVAGISLKIQEDEIRREITWLNGSFPLPAEKVGKFIDAFREEVKGIPKENWGEAMDMILPGETALLSYGTFRDSHWEKVLDRCQDGFQQSEIRMIKDFIRDHRQPGDVLDLQIRKKFCISAPDAEMPVQTV